MSKKIFITDTILRDAHQSQAATRMRVEDMLPACEALAIGPWSAGAEPRLTHASASSTRIRGTG